MPNWKSIDPDIAVEIYSLIDPRNNQVKYVGWTYQSLKDRLLDHLSDARRGIKNKRCNWIRKLLKEEIIPEIRNIETTTYADRNEREKYWISVFGRENLVNGTDGGEGVAGLVFSEDSLRKLSESHMGQKAWNKGVKTPYVLEWLTPFKKGNIPHNKGKSWTQDIKDKISKTKSGVRIGKKRVSSSIYVGVTLYRNKKSWISQIKYNNTNNRIGTFKEELYAAIAYDFASLFLYGYNTNLNFPESRQNYIDYLNQFQINDIKDLRKVIKQYIVELQKGG